MFLLGEFLERTKEKGIGREMGEEKHGFLDD